MGGGLPGGRSRDLPSAASGSSRGGGGRGGGMPSVGEAGQEMNFTVRWDSALPIRQAVMRAHYGPQVKSVEEAQKTLNTKVSHYAISLLVFPARMA